MAFLDTVASDLDTLLSDFGVLATITRADAVVLSSVSGIYDAPFAAENLATGTVEQVAPQFVAKTSALTDVRHHDILTVSGADWYIVGIEPDGTGLTRLVLSSDRP